MKALKTATLNLHFLLPSFLEAIKRLLGKKTNAVPYLNRSPLIISYGFYVYDSFNAPSYNATHNRMISILQ